MAIHSPLGYQQITSLSAAVAPTVPANTERCLLQAETQNVRFRDDGTDPTATVGMILVAGAAPFPYEGNVSALKFIEATASAKLNILYYPERTYVR